MIALGRLLIAAVFLLAVYLDPSQPNRNPDVAYSLLLGYVVWSAAFSVVTWTNWWLDYRLAGFAHIVDVAAFGILVFVTEGYTSPFYTFFVFLLLSSAIRWSWRETAITAAAVAFLFFGAGAATMAAGSTHFDLQQLLIRLIHLVVLSLLLIWFGVNQDDTGEKGSAGLEPQPDSESPPTKAAMQYAAGRTGAGRLIFAWWQKEEPWVHLFEYEDDRLSSRRVGPEEYERLFPDETKGSAFLFDRGRQRGLCRHSEDSHRLRRFRQTFEEGFADRYRLKAGLAVRIQCDEYEGELLALDIDGLCADDLETGQKIGRDISALFDRSAKLAGSEEAAFTRARMSLARDLHDSVVQVLAGAAFRLEALKSWIKAGRDPEPEIEAVKADLTTEQRNIRAFIASLRSGRNAIRHTDLSAGLPELCEQLKRRWNLTCELTRSRGEIEGPIWVEHELHQIVREAAANAAKHGQATTLRVDLRQEGDELELSISDNGIGFPSVGGNGGTAPSPWTVHERVKGLGGTLSLFSGGVGSRLQIRVPLGAN